MVSEAKKNREGVGRYNGNDTVLRVLISEELYDLLKTKAREEKSTTSALVRRSLEADYGLARLGSFEKVGIA